jgi:hypothetical protein
MKRTAPQKKLRRRGLFAWLREVAGHATAETVIMIPVFVVIWGGIWYTHQRYRKAINMAQLTRAHVWAHAYGGCEGSPPGGTTIGEHTDDRDGFFGVVDFAIGSGILPGFQFDEIEGRRDTSLDRPAVLGEGRVTMGHNLVVLCNERTQEERGELWLDALDAIL